MAESPRYALYLRTTMEVLHDAEDRMSPRDVIAQVEWRIRPTGYEQEPNRRGGQLRWITILKFMTGDAVTIGWMTKIGGWALTEAGREALEIYPAAYELNMELSRRFQEVDQQRKRAQANLDEVHQFVADAVALVSEGQWTSHEDLAELTGVSIQEIAHFLASGKVRIPGSYRVLNPDGSIPPEGMLHHTYRGGTHLRDRLEQEGIEFDDNSRAAPAQRIDAGDLKEMLEQRRPPPPLATQRAWMVRGTSMEGHNLVDIWLGEGWVSLAASQLSDIPADFQQ